MCGLERILFFRIKWRRVAENADQLFNLLNIQLFRGLNALAAKLRRLLSTIFFVPDEVVDQLRESLDRSGYGCLTLGPLDSAPFLWLRKQTSEKVADLLPQLIVRNRVRNSVEVFVEIGLVDPGVLFREQISGRQDDMMSVVDGQLEYARRPSLRLVVELHLWHGDFSPQ